MSFQDQREDEIPPTLEVENKWESNDAMIDAMIILFDTKITDNF